jgi:hypothetical protein
VVPQQLGDAPVAAVELPALEHLRGELLAHDAGRLVT